MGEAGTLARVLDVGEASRAKRVHRAICGFITSHATNMSMQTAGPHVR